MAKRSTLPPSQDQKKFRQDDEGMERDNYEKPNKQENQSNRGYEEDQPHNPVRTTGSTRPDQESDLSSRK
ncbi:MAG TPA: hypothetical protein VD996_04785 [Chitinophagaceae bacterium]|nr:hypothetical protein [Chitinophagaceae bacterium]